MASQVAGTIHDQNLNVHCNASAGGKTNVSKALKKGGLGGRKPLGDLSNSVQLTTPNQSLKKHSSNIFSFTEKEIGASKITFAGKEMKTIYKASEKPQSSTRKALLDISNAGKPHLHEASKKNPNAKLSILEEQHLNAVAEEDFLHNHHKCIKAQKKAMDIDELLITVGLDIGFPKQPLSPWVASPALNDFKFQPACPPRCLEFEEVAEHAFGDASKSPKKHEQFSDLDSPKPPSHCGQWDEVNFMLMKTPCLPKH